MREPAVLVLVLTVGVLLGIALAVGAVRWAARRRLAGASHRALPDPGAQGAAERAAVQALVRPLQDTLARVSDQLARAEVERAAAQAELREQVRSTLRDLQSLEEHASFLSSKIQFLLDATLGLVNLEQNNIIKLFSVMAVVFMPPTLIASVYGMNFKFMPELDWHLGYPMAMGMMVVAAIAPYLFFRWKKWL